MENCTVYEGHARFESAQLVSVGSETITADQIFILAVGRRPNTDDLRLDKAGVELDQRGYVVDDRLRTSVPGIWAMGDRNGRGAFTHTSFNDAEIIAANLLDNDPRRVSDRIPAYGLYIDPPLGRRPHGEPRGFMKIVIDAETRGILGATILGVGGDEAIHSILDVMYAKAPYTVIQRAVHIHPTVSELIPTMIGELQPLASRVRAST